MGEIADMMINGESCSHCSTMFKNAHGYPVLCRECFDTESKEERAGLQRTTEEEM